jgi:hypothetical protein
MLSGNLKFARFAGIALCLTALFGAFLYLNFNTASAASNADAEKQMEAVKSQMESGNNSAFLQKEYRMLANITSNCGLANRLTEPTIKAPFAPLANLCINGALAAADPTYNRILASSTGTGVGTGVVGNCSLSGSGTATHYDAYSFNLTGCAVFPTVVTASLCGPAGCVAPGTLDSVLTLYRNVPAGDPLTANGGLPGVFNAASPCTNARAANDDSGATSTSTGGSTCNQLNTADCLAQCAAPASTSNSEFKRSLGSGRFTIVITTFGNTTTLNSYNLYVDAPSAGCAVALAPTSANAGISGRVTNSSGSGIAKANVTLTNSNTGETLELRTNPFGYYSFDDLEVGDSYIVTVSSKSYTFNPQTRTVSLEDNISDADFVSEQ